MVPAEHKAKCLWLVNHIPQKTIHHHLLLIQFSVYDIILLHQILHSSQETKGTELL